MRHSPWLSYLSVFPVKFAKLTTGHFFPALSLLSSSVCKLYKVNKCSFCLYYLSLSLLEPSIQYETVAVRIQWREGKKCWLIPTSRCLKQAFGVFDPDWDYLSLSRPVKAQIKLFFGRMIVLTSNNFTSAGSQFFQPHDQFSFYRGT